MIKEIEEYYVKSQQMRNPIDYEFWLRISKICEKYKWYHQVIGWYWNGYVSKQEIIDAVEYLEKLNVSDN